MKTKLGEGYQPTKPLENTNPPQGGSAVPPKEDIDAKYNALKCFIFWLKGFLDATNGEEASADNIGYLRDRVNELFEQINNNENLE